VASPRELELGQRIHIGPAVLRLRIPGGGQGMRLTSRRSRLRERPSGQFRIALLAAAAGFLFATALGLWTARMYPQWLSHLTGRTLPALHQPGR
jgi:hypothetical protein